MRLLLAKPKFYCNKTRTPLRRGLFMRGAIAKTSAFLQKDCCFRGTAVSCKNKKRSLSCNSSGSASFRLAESWGFAGRLAPPSSRCAPAALAGFAGKRLRRFLSSAPLTRFESMGRKQKKRASWARFLISTGGELGIRTPEGLCGPYSLSRRAPSASRSALRNSQTIITHFRGLDQGTEATIQN